MDVDALIERIRSGSTEAETELHAYLAPGLLRFVRSQLGRMLSRRLDPDDMVQETLSAILLVLRKKKREIRHLDRFAKTVARHVMYREAQRRSVRFRPLRSPQASGMLPAHDPAASAAGPKTEIFRRERKNLLEDALKSLTPRDMQIVRLRFQSSGQKLSFKEIARTLGMNPAAAEKAYLRAMERLRERLKRLQPGPGETGNWFE